MLRWSLSVLATAVIFAAGMFCEHFRHSCNCGGSGVLRAPDPDTDEPPLAVDPNKPLKVIVTKYTADGKPYQEEIIVPPKEQKQEDKK